MVTPEVSGSNVVLFPSILNNVYRLKHCLRFIQQLTLMKHYPTKRDCQTSPKESLSIVHYAAVVVLYPVMIHLWAGSFKRMKDCFHPL